MKTQTTKELPFRFLFPILLYLFILTGNMPAQNLIRGTVTDSEDGTPLTGANILIKGTLIGVSTDNFGKYSIQANAEDTLVFSFVGYLSDEIIAGNQTLIDVTLKPSFENLDEVVVIGYGTQKKSDLTGSIAVVDVNDMNKSQFNSLDKALQGRAAGVHVSNTSGQPGEPASIKIRGVGSISLSSEPLFVIDGMATTERSILYSLNPDDIESLQVLKDASATAIYGARGANGVIIVTTKKGTVNKTSLSFSSNISFTSLSKKFDVMDAGQYTRFMEKAYGSYLSRYPAQADNYTKVYCDSARASNNNLGTNTNFIDAFTRTAVAQNYNMSISGGGERSSFFLSGSFTNEEGVMINTGSKRYTIRTNSDYKIGSRIKVGEAIAITRTDAQLVTHFASGNMWLSPLINSPYMPLYDSTAIGGYGGPVDTLTGNNERTNPVAEQMLNSNTYTEYRILSSLFAEIDLFKGLSFTLRVGGNINHRNEAQWSPQYTLGNMKLRDHPISSLYERSNYSQELLWNNMLTYSKSFGAHTITAMASYERTAYDSKYTYAEGNDIPFENLPVLDQAKIVKRVGGGNTEHNLESMLARVIYDYKGKYLLTASYRIDGSSRFGPEGGRYGQFPSFSAGWKINEDYLRNIDQINMLKLRFGWGMTGNENLEDYMYFALLDPYQNSRYNFGLGQTLYLGAASTSFQSNPLIKWEAAEMYNVGVDLDAFNNRVQFSVEYYIKDQEDMLVKKPISVIFGKKVGYGTTGKVDAWVNLAHVQNRGLEVNAIYKKMEGDFNYVISANLTTLKNRVIDLGIPDVFTDFTITKPGNSIGSFYGYVAERILQEEDFQTDESGKPVITDNKYTLLHPFQETGTAPGDIKYKDLNRDGVINDKDMTVIGKPLPDYIYGLNFDLFYRNINLTVFLQGMQNMEVYNDLASFIGIATDRDAKDNNKLVSVMDYWTPENRSNSMTRVDVLDENKNYRPSTWFIEDASFLRIKSIQIGYSLPANWIGRIGISKFRIYASANNILTLTKYSGYDPEIGSTNPLLTGIENGVYPVSRTIMLGLQFDF